MALVGVIEHNARLKFDICFDSIPKLHPDIRNLFKYVVEGDLVLLVPPVDVSLDMCLKKFLECQSLIRADIAV
jgi:hypothetical protein